MVLGGGTGLSTVLGGNSSLPAWSARPTVGLMNEFQQVDVGVCTTDDGGSTGALVRRLPMIGIGDLRKVMLSMINRAELARRYGDAPPALRVIQQVFLHRFGNRAPRRAELHDPVRVLEPGLRKTCPARLRQALAGLTEALHPAVEDRLLVPGHCLGNLLLTAALFGRRGPSRPPAMRAVESGLRAVSRVIGVPPDCVFPATATPGTLRYEYANGVVASGQARAARARRGSAVRWVQIAFASDASAHPRLLQRLRAADAIVYAPGSLYSSILPVLLTPGITDAIRANRRALKILGANLWIQEGETDMSFREPSRGFWVSELIEAYGRNIPGGINGLFDVALAASLDSVPGSIIRQYALEGKHPIHLDRERVAKLGVTPVEAGLFSREDAAGDSMVHHDPARFALAIRTLYAEWSPRPVRQPRADRRMGGLSQPVSRRSAASANVRMDAIEAALARIPIRSPGLRARLADCFWQYPDLQPDHLAGVDGVEVVPDARWKRSREWDNILGYFHPETRRIMLHEQIIPSPASLQGNFTVALGESLLGRYIAAKRWRETDNAGGCRIYEIELRPPARRVCLLSDRQLKAYLRMAEMRPMNGRPLNYWRAVPPNTGFLPTGILFGLTFAWMLDNTFVPALDYEMQVLHWPASRLLPFQVQQQKLHRQLVRFFRREVFGGD